MDRASPKPRAACFGVFEADFEQRILTKGGLRVKLQEQPFQVLEMLLERPGELVGREEIRQRLWPADTFVEFDDGLNTAIKKLRAALADSAENPRFIETVPRRGYRFIVPVTNRQPVAHETNNRKPSDFPDGGSRRENESRAAQASGVAEPQTTQSASKMTLDGETSRRRRPRILIAASCFLGAVILIGLGWGLRTREPSRAGRKKISLAVLPLEDLSPGHSEEYLSEGLTDELITDLAKLPGFRVISRTSTMQYKGTSKALPQVARELKVDELVEGTVLRSGDRVRVRVQLIQGGTDEHLWAEAYERDMKDVLALQSEVARAIAGQIKLELGSREGEPARGTARTVNFEAYAACLKGRYEWNKRTAESLKKSIEYFEESIQRDPSYVEAHEGLAEVYSILPDYDVMTAEESYPRARAEALKALKLDPALG